MSGRKYAKEIQVVRDRREGLRRETFRRGFAVIEASWGIERILDRMRRIPRRLDQLDKETSPIGAGVTVGRTLEFLSDTALWLDAEEAFTTTVLGDDEENRMAYASALSNARAELSAQQTHLGTLATTLERAEEEVIRKMARAIAAANLAPVVDAQRAEKLTKAARNLRSVFIDLPRAVNELATGEALIETRLARIDALLVMARNLRLLLPDLVGAPELDEARKELTEVIERRLSIAQAQRDAVAAQALRPRMRAAPVNDEGPGYAPSSGPRWLSLPPEEGCIEREKVNWALKVELGRPLDEPLPEVWNGQEVCPPRTVEWTGERFDKGEAAPAGVDFDPIELSSVEEIIEEIEEPLDEHDPGLNGPLSIRARLDDLETRMMNMSVKAYDPELEAIAAEVRRLVAEMAAADGWLDTTKQILATLKETAGPQLRALTAEVRRSSLPLSVAYPTMNPDEVAVMKALDPGAAIMIGIILLNPTFVAVPAAMTAGLLAYAAADLLTRFVAQVSITEWVLSSLENRSTDKKKLEAFNALLDAVEIILDLALLGNNATNNVRGLLNDTKDALGTFRDLEVPEDVIARLVKLWQTGNAAQGALLKAIASPETCRGVLPTLEQASPLVTAMSDQNVVWSSSVADGGKTVVWSAVSQPVRVEIHQAKGSTPGWVKLSHGVWAVDSVGRFVSHDAMSARIPLTSLTESLSAKLLRRILNDPLPEGAP